VIVKGFYLHLYSTATYTSIAFTPRYIPLLVRYYSPPIPVMITVNKKKDKTLDKEIMKMFQLFLRKTCKPVPLPRMHMCR